MTLDFTRHREFIAKIAQKLPPIADSISVTFDSVAKIAKEVVKKLVSAHPDRVQKSPLTRSVFGQEVAFDHFAEYVSFDGVVVGLGYDVRHWACTSDIRIPWRVVLYLDTNPKEIPAHVEDRISKHDLRDGITWVDSASKPKKNMEYPFLLIPKDALPSEDDPDYVSKLAEAVFTFIDGLLRR